MTNLGKVDLSDPRPMREIVFEKIKGAIYEGRLKKEDRLVESTIAENLGVSRTPVREALRQLESEGLVKNYPRRGAVVQGISIEDAVEIYDLREVLEGLMARKTCENISDGEIRELRKILLRMRDSIDGKDFEYYLDLHRDYNQLLMNNCKSQRLISMINNIHEYLASLRGITLTTKDRREEAYHEHVGIVEALEQRDAQRVEVLARDHAVNAKKAFLDSVST